MRRGPEFNPRSGGWHPDEDTSHAERRDAGNATPPRQDLPDWPPCDDPRMDPRRLTPAAQLILAADQAAARRAGGQLLYQVLPGPRLGRL